jgi:hypothetical protein
MYSKLINEKDEEIKNLEIAFKTETNIKKQYENDIKILKEKIKELTLSNNGSLIITSEFKILWKDLGNQISILFKNFYDFPFIIFNLIQELLCILERNINSKIEYIKKNFIQVLSPGTEKINMKDLNNILKELIRKNIKNIFLTNEIEISSIIDNYIKFFENYITNDNNKQLYKNFQKLISNEKFEILIEIMKTILIYVKYNDTDLNLDIKEYSDRNIEIKQFYNKEVISINSISKNENINGIYLIKPPFLKSGYCLVNNIFPIILETNNLKTLNDEVEDYNNSKINIRNNERKKILNNKKIKLNYIIPNNYETKYKLIYQSNIYKFSKKENIKSDLSGYNSIISERKQSPTYCFTNSIKLFKQKKINNCFTLKEKKRQNSFLKYNTNFSNEESDYKCEVQKNNLQFINKQVLKDLIAQGERKMKIKLIKKPNLLLKNISINKENLKNKKTENNSATETTITVEYSSNTFNNPKTNCNLNYPYSQKNLKNNLFLNIGSRKIKKNSSFAKKNNTNISSRIIKNNFCLNENGKNIKNKEIKSLEDVIKTNKRPNINAKKFFQN